MELILIGINIALAIVIILVVLTNKPKALEQKELDINQIITPVQNKLHEQDLNVIREFGNQKAHLEESMAKSDQRLMEALNVFNASVNKQILDQMEAINRKVDVRLDEGFEKTNKTFQDVLQRLTIIDEAQKKMEGLSTNIISLQDILTDKRSRGAFGEIQLEHILVSIFGENKPEIYEMQKTMSNGTRVDSILYAPEPLGTIGIDSKFPLENYRKMVDKNLSDFEKTQAEKDFKADVKKHITDIHNKYIIAGETSDQAIMFVPAEAIFAEIHAYHEDLITFSQKNRVWIVSPTTLMATLTTIQVVIKNMERDKYAKVIHEHLVRLGDDFRRFNERWTGLQNSISTVTKRVDELNITQGKIAKRFDSIQKAEISNVDTDPIFIETENL